MMPTAACGKFRRAGVLAESPSSRLAVRHGAADLLARSPSRRLPQWRYIHLAEYKQALGSRSAISSTRATGSVLPVSIPGPSRTSPHEETGWYPDRDNLLESYLESEALDEFGRICCPGPRNRPICLKWHKDISKPLGGKGVWPWLCHGICCNSNLQSGGYMYLWKWDFPLFIYGSIQYLARFSPAVSNCR